MRIVKTIANGDCGLDVMCLMLDWSRCDQNRNVLRSEMAAFALRHLGNRAFIAMLAGVGESRTHLGLIELGQTGAELLEEAQPGDGDGPPAGAGTPEAAQRHFSDEESIAVTWTCRLEL